MLVHMREVPRVLSNKCRYPDRKQYQGRHGKLITANFDEIDNISGGSEQLLGTVIPEAFRNVVFALWKCRLIKRTDWPATAYWEEWNVFSERGNSRTKTLGYLKRCSESL